MTDDKSPDNWYAFHFGNKVAQSAQFDPNSLFSDNQRECYVMIADLCSFTAFCKATDNMKTVAPLITGFYSQVRSAILQHGGMLDKIIGDAVVALWGLHSSQDLAIDSALEASHELSLIANQLCEQWQSQVDLLIEPKGVRIGLSKGPIVVIPRDEKYSGLSLLGNAINLAARLQQAAEANQLVCSNLVYKDVEQASLNASFRPYAGQSTQGFIDAKNYGPIKAWSMTLTKAG